MAYFDFLIDKENKNPKSDMEYIYRLDMVWKPNELGGFPILPNSIVKNVVKLPNNSYEFIVKDTGEKYRCNYGWAFAENTKENIEKIEAYEIEKTKLDLLKLEVDELNDKITKLK